MPFLKLSRFIVAAILPMTLFSFAALATGDEERGGHHGGRKVSVCHGTSSATNPFVKIEVSENAVPAHMGHGDVYPNGSTCPGAVGGTPTATPEPVTMLLFGAGLAGVGYAARRRKRQAK